MSQFINTVIYERVAKKHGVRYQEVEAIANHVGNTIRTVIEQNDPNQSVKLDGLGNFVSFRVRRSKVIKD
jgi:nucleoid DNA-binding protein